MFPESKVTEIYCMADDFCKEFTLQQEKYMIEDRNRMPDMRIWYLPCVKTKIYPSKIFLLG